MFAFRKVGRWPAATLSLALAGAALLAVAGDVTRTPLLPWNAVGYRGYHEATRPSQPPPPVVTAAPQKYTITITILPQQMPEEDPNIAVIMAHLPEDALLWFDDYATRSKGMLRTFQSPPLTPGKHYSYRARIVWHENGEWVSQTQKLPVQAGQIHCLYLTATAAHKEVKIAANLAKLSIGDRQLAEAQKVCAVQPENLLGSMGVPVKVMIQGQPVFLCCKGCQEKVLENPDQTLAKVKELKGKNAVPPRK
jgi:uncharacterized protein (TIGR03000 family)